VLIQLVFLFIQAKIPIQQFFQGSLHSLELPASEICVFKIFLKKKLFLYPWMNIGVIVKSRMA
jgi:hypothetical protein